MTPTAAIAAMAEVIFENDEMVLTYRTDDMAHDLLRALADKGWTLARAESSAGERALREALEGMVDVFANGRGIDRSRAIGFCVLSDEGHAAINEARAALTDTGGTE